MQAGAYNRDDTVEQQDEAATGDQEQGANQAHKNANGLQGKCMWHFLKAKVTGI